MAAIAPSDPYQIFMRKIGWSVGLEHTLSRILDTAEVYVDESQLKRGAWDRLVHEKWGLKNDQVGDFFHALGILHRTKSQVDILPGLDLFGVILKQFGRDAGLDGFKISFLSMLIEHDGEIFLNALATQFEEAKFVAALTELISYKRAVLSQIYRSPEIQSQIWRVVGIERQATNTGGAGGGKGLSAQRRQQPLEKRKEPLNTRGAPPIVISPDYLRKVLPRRREWANSLGLFDPKAGLTDRGSRLLDSLSACKLRLESGPVVLWPFSHEISRLRLNPTMFEGRIVDFWTLVELSVIGGGGNLKATEGNDWDTVLDLAQEQISIYRQLNLPKAMLRYEYPVTLAYISIAAALVVRGKHVPSLPEIIEQERQSDRPRLSVRSSRNSMMALALR